MIAILAAGGTPQPGEALYSYTQGLPKALLDICGKPMIQWVLDALGGARSVDQVVLVGLPEHSGLTCTKPVTFIPNQGGLLQNMRAGMSKALAMDSRAHHILSVSSDIPGITAPMVDWVVEAATQTDQDAYYFLIKREVMEARFPSSRRTYTYLRDMTVCGGDISVIRTQIGTENDALWERIISARKNVFKQAALIGWDTLLLMLFRLIALNQAVKIVTQRLQISGQAIVCPYPEIGMDVDKPFQLEIMRADLARQSVA